MNADTTALQPQIARTPQGGWIVTYELDPHQPFLNDHRPGGRPLLGTVMGIELMASAARAVSGSACIASLDEVRILEPLIFANDQQHSMQIRVRLHGADHNDSRLDCEAYSLTANQEVLHFTARCQPATHYATATTVTIPDLSMAREVTTKDVYALFFHGPAFQVIGDARWSSEVTLSHINTDLPAAYKPAEKSTVMAPRVIEFGLQTAGLMSIAAIGRNMIPDRIARIQRYSAVEIGAPLLAVATSAGDATDIQIMDQQGRLQLSVRGYHTVPLPFAVNAQAVTELQRKLRERVSS